MKQLVRVKNEVQFEAVQFLTGDPENITGWLLSANKPVSVGHDPDGVITHIELMTPEGHTVMVDTDWLLLPESGTADDFEVFTDEEYQRAFELVP